MKSRANNEAERRYKVGDRVLLKNTKRNRNDEPRFSNPGLITAVKDGSFTIALESGGPSPFTSLTTPIHTFLSATTRVGARLLRHCPLGALSDPLDPLLPDQAPSSLFGNSSSSSSSSLEDDGDGDGEEGDASEDDPPEVAQSPEKVAASGNLLVVSDFFAQSTAPKNFAHSMRAVSGKRKRKKRRLDSDEMDFEPT